IECMGSPYSSFRLLQTWEGHSGRITAVALSPDGRWVASGSSDRTVRLWSMPDGQLLATLSGHTEAGTGGVFLRVGGRLASSVRVGWVRLWDVDPGGQPGGTVAPAQVFDVAAGSVNAIDASADGAWLGAGCQKGTIHLPSLSAKPSWRELKGHRA